MNAASSAGWVDVAKSISREVLARWAADVDERGRYPREGMDALGDAGLLTLLVPKPLGGAGGDYDCLCRISAILGEECLSTALIWAMHCQQVKVLADDGSPAALEILRGVVEDRILVASVTSERDKGGDLLRAQAPLVRESNGGIRVRRSAPIVSYGGEAGAYLVTMRSGEDRPSSDVSLVLVKPADGQVRVDGTWNAMGMRGTASVPMTFDVVVDDRRIIGPTFRDVALRSMIPAGHLGWSAAWLGGARGAFRRFAREARTMGSRGERRLDSDLFTTRLARARASLDAMEATVHQMSARLDRMAAESAPADAYEDVTHNIALNNVKVMVAELSFSVIDGLLELGGLARGYLKNDRLGIERVFRDLRSAAMMYSNDRLLAANGRLILVERESD